MFGHDRRPNVAKHLGIEPTDMRKTFTGLALIASLTVPGAAIAADNTVVGVGTGAVAGAVVGGPIGAVVGAVAGGLVGANTQTARTRYRHRARITSRRRAAGFGAARRLASASAPSPIRSVAHPAPLPPSRPGSDGAASETRTWTDPE